jgi:hypothetical protein
MERDHLYKITYGHFHVFVWSDPDLLANDMKNLYDEGGYWGPSEPLDTDWDKCELICKKCEILEVGTDHIKL